MEVGVVLVGRLRLERLILLRLKLFRLWVGVGVDCGWLFFLIIFGNVGGILVELFSGRFRVRLRDGLLVLGMILLRV